MKQTLYSSRSNLYIGFHGCDKSVVEYVINGGNLKPSQNSYDWLGHGIYFWENNEARALQFAEEASKRKSSSIKNPAVIGAVIDLGYCLDLTDMSCLYEIKQSYNALKMALNEVQLPKNKVVGTSSDLLIRNLDCAVIEFEHTINEKAKVKSFDSVRGIFVEGDELFPNSGIREKNHIQICVRNPNCIKGYFLPRVKDEKYSNPE
ncbi:MAG: hypothetical protein J6S84_00680 [Bacteroidales bacterium]|nr:hypothetical protein [Bacteroidales bacterium]